MLGGEVVNARDRRAVELDAAPEILDTAPVVDNRRLALAGRVAGGIASNPGVWEGADPEGTIARIAWRIAGRLITLAETGGC